VQEPRRDNSKRSPANSFLLAQAFRPFREQSESESPFVPFIGGPRIFVMLLYASVIVATSVQYFVSQRVWFGSWNLYNTYVFIVTGVFVFLGMVMLFYAQREISEEYTLRVPKRVLGMAGFAMLALSGLALVYWGKSLGAWAIPLSITLLYGFLVVLIGGRGFETKEAIRLTLYGTGLVVMIMVPVHESFGVLKTPEDEFYFFTLLNLVLLITGMTLALFALQSLQTRDGFVGAWLLGAMAIFLIAFHEQLGIVASGNYSPYDRGLALIGIAFSFLPLAMYFWRERVYFFLWRRLKQSQTLMMDGDFEGALKHADAAIRQCSRVGIEDRFALPWSLKADALYRMKDFPKAMVHYDTALRIDPKDSTSWDHLGKTYALEGKHAEALKAFDQAVKVDPANGSAWNNRGVVLEVMGRYEEAIVSFDKAIGYMEDPFDPHFNLAKLFSRLGHSTDSVRHYQAAIAIRPMSEAANDGLQREFHRSKCLDQISGWEQLGLDVSYLRRILDDDPKDFVKKSKEFLKSIADEKTPLEVVPAKEHMDFQFALQTIVRMTEGDGATIEQLEEYTGLQRKDLILPLALLVETDKVHFKVDGEEQVYVAKGKPPEKPPPAPKKARVVRPPVIPPEEAPEKPVEAPRPPLVEKPAEEVPSKHPAVPKIIEMHKPHAEAPKAVEVPEPVEVVKPAEAPKIEEPARPVEVPKPEEAPKPVETPEPAEAPKPAEAPRPAETPKPVEAPEPAEIPKPIEAPKPAEVQQPIEAPKSVEAPKPVEPPIPVEAPKTPVVAEPVHVQKEVSPPEEQPEEKPTAPVLKAIEEQLERLSARAPPPIEVRIQERLEELDEGSSVACPTCGLPVGLFVTKCPYCGAEFREEIPLAEPEPPPKPAPKRPEPVVSIMEDEEPPSRPPPKKRLELRSKKLPKPEPKPKKAEPAPPAKKPKKEEAKAPPEKKKLLKKFEKKPAKKAVKVPEKKPEPKPEKKKTAKVPAKKAHAEKKPDKKAAGKPKPKKAPKPAPKEKSPVEEKGPPKREVVKVEPTAGILFFRKKKK